MKRIILIGTVFSLFLLMAGCKHGSEIIRYELVGGNPEVDYIDFLNDSLCRFVAPGSLTITRPYSKERDTYVIQIAPLVKAYLYKVDDNTLRGNLPFFDGIWIEKEK